MWQRTATNNFFFSIEKKRKTELVAAFGWVANLILISFHLSLVSFYSYFTFYFHLLFIFLKKGINQNKKENNKTNS